ncbi:MAG: AAA family ATPase, partial [Aliifodinibius sp.]|nr:ATP-binding protein [Fodinibius sp.]NIV16723.1 AAA family ATPase [Fodinibius sp.]NIY25457.1 AAA family ATPase [Fodinibius sp.]
MENLTSSSNPYTIDEAVSDPVMFFGRSELFSWIEDMLQNRPLGEPLILFGPPGVGKSSILKQLALGRLGEGMAVFQTDIKNLPLENLCSFLWALAEKINEDTVSSDVKILVSPVEYSRFSAEPGAAFEEFLAIIREDRLQEKQLVMAFDDLDILIGQSQEGYPEYEILSYLHNLLQRDKDLSCIITLNVPVDKLPPNALAPFNLSNQFEVSNFDLETTLTFLKQSVLFNTSAVVGEYIFKLTDGHPGDIQRLCYRLYERRLKNQLLHITLADVASITRQS